MVLFIWSREDPVRLRECVSSKYLFGVYIQLSCHLHHHLLEACHVSIVRLWSDAKVRLCVDVAKEFYSLRFDVVVRVDNMTHHEVDIVAVDSSSLHLSLEELPQ